MTSRSGEFGSGEIGICPIACIKYVTVEYDMPWLAIVVGSLVITGIIMWVIEVKVKGKH